MWHSTNYCSVHNISSQSEEWHDVRKHLAAGNPSGDMSTGGKTRLELKMETALQKGDYSLADQLSDQLSNRQVMCRNSVFCSLHVNNTYV